MKNDRILHEVYKVFNVCGMNKYQILLVTLSGILMVMCSVNQTCWCLNQQNWSRQRLSLRLDFVKCMGNNQFLLFPLALQTLKCVFPT